MPDAVLDYHRLKVPIDHPDSSIARVKLEYATADVSFSYLDSINKAYGAPAPNWDMVGSRTVDVFADIAIEGVISDAGMVINVRSDGVFTNRYAVAVNTGRSRADFWLHRVVNRGVTDLASEAVDLPGSSSHLAKLSVSGSTLKGFREDLTTPKLVATDTTFVSGYVSIGSGWGRQVSSGLSYFLRSPSTETNPSVVILEVEVAGSGDHREPYAPSLSRQLVEIDVNSNLPDFLKREKRKYDVLRAKGFTDEEVELIFGYVPQHQVDLDAVTWGVFEFSEKSPTNIIMVFGDSQYSPGAVERQVEFAESKGLRALRSPRDYGEAAEQYKQLSRDFQHWIAGKDNYVYQTLGLEVFDLFQNVDFYYGELVEHRTHYDQLKRVPEDELWRRLETLQKELAMVGVLAEERDKHMDKLKAVVKLGW